MSDKYYLTPGSRISKTGREFKGGIHKIEADKDKFYELSAEDIKVFELNIPYMIAVGKMVDEKGRSLLLNPIKEEVKKIEPKKKDTDK